MSVPDTIRSKVQSLNLFGSDVTDNGLKHLVKLPNLKVLGLCGCEGLTNGVVETLVNKSNLEVLGNKYRMGRFGNFPPIGYMTKVKADDDLLTIRQDPRNYDVIVQRMPDLSNPNRGILLWSMFG